MFAIAIHGGAGTLSRRDMTAGAGRRTTAPGSNAALDAGYAVLERSGSSLDATIAAVRVLEDNPLFNAGRGAVLNRDGVAELDASLMDGRTLARRRGQRAQAREEPDRARAAGDGASSPHVMLVGEGAEEFARSQGVELVSNEYFRTPVRQQQLRAHAARRADPRERTGRVRDGRRGGAGSRTANIAAATSTGGMTGKRWGRVGDSPIIGAGTYANNASCAVSATGHGEYFIRTVVAHDICAQVRVPQGAAGGGRRQRAQRQDEGARRQRRRDRHRSARARSCIEFNSEGMFRGVRTSQGRREVAIYR